jgi:hypothetical protein
MSKTKKHLHIIKTIYLKAPKALKISEANNRRGRRPKDMRFTFRTTFLPKTIATFNCG